MFCARCGTKNDDNGKFCMNCGAPLSQTGAAGSAGQGPSGYGTAGPAGQGPSGYGMAGPAGQGPSGYGMAGPAGQGPSGYGAAGPAGQSPSGYGAAGPAGHNPPGYGTAGASGQYSPGYGGAQTAYAAAPAKKKNIVPIIAIVAVAAVAIVAVYFLFIRSPLVGTWSYTEYGASISFTFKAGGKGEMTLKYFGEKESTPFKWKELSGKRLQMTADGETVIFEYSIKGDTLTLTEEGGRSSQKLIRDK